MLHDGHNLVLPPAWHLSSLPSIIVHYDVCMGLDEVWEPRQQHTKCNNPFRLHRQFLITKIAIQNKFCLVLWPRSYWCLTQGWNIHDTLLACDKYHTNIISVEEFNHKNKVHTIKASYMVYVYTHMLIHNIVQLTISHVII